MSACKTKFYPVKILLTADINNGKVVFYRYMKCHHRILCGNVDRQLQKHKVSNINNLLKLAMPTFNAGN